jgi:hypothetical protein
MKRLLTWFSLGLGLTLGGGVAYAFSISEAMRLVTVGIGAFLLAALTIGGTALIVNCQWTKALGAQSHRTTHNHRYPSHNFPPATMWDGTLSMQPPELLPPALGVEFDLGRGDLDDEVVA